MDRRYTAKFMLTLEDYEQLCRASRRLTPFRRRMAVAHVGMLALFSMAAVAFWWAGDRATAVLIFAALGLIAFLTYVVGPWQMRRQFENQRLGASAIDLVADEAGVETRSTLSESRNTWAAIQKVDELPDHVILWPNDRVGLIVPRRGFSSPDAADGFIALAREKVG